MCVFVRGNELGRFTKFNFIDWMAFHVHVHTSLLMHANPLHPKLMTVVELVLLGHLKLNSKFD